MYLTLSSASRTPEEQRQKGSWRGSQKDGWGPGGSLGRVLAVSPSIAITVCVQIDPFLLGTLGGMGRGGTYRVICVHVKPQMAQPEAAESMAWIQGIPI